MCLNKVTTYILFKIIFKTYLTVMDIKVILTLILFFDKIGSFFLNKITSAKFLNKYN